MERVVLVHGSVVSGRPTWATQKPLAERFELFVLDRPGFPPNPPVERVDLRRTRIWWQVSSDGVITSSDIRTEASSAS